MLVPNFFFHLLESLFQSVCPCSLWTGPFGISSKLYKPTKQNPTQSNRTQSSQRAIPLYHCLSSPGISCHALRIKPIYHLYPSSCYLCSISYELYRLVFYFLLVVEERDGRRETFPLQVVEETPWIRSYKSLIPPPFG